MVFVCRKKTEKTKTQKPCVIVTVLASAATLNKLTTICRMKIDEFVSVRLYFTS